jgi:hypothetical protein
MTSIIIIAIFLNVAHAIIDGYMIKKNIKINHTLGATIYLIVCVVVCLLFADLWHVIPMLCIRPVVFDPLLNIFRGLNPFHVSMTTTSVIDKWERKVTTNGFVQWLIWMGATILSIVLINVL